MDCWRLWVRGCFALGEDHAVWHCWWDGVNCGGQESFGGMLTSSPTAVWDENWFDIFALGQDHGLWRRWWDSSNWNRRGSLGGILVSPLQALSSAPNRLDVYGIGIDNALYVHTPIGS